MQKDMLNKKLLVSVLLRTIMKKTISVLKVLIKFNSLS
jgi:hypothetical protein